MILDYTKLDKLERIYNWYFFTAHPYVGAFLITLWHGGLFKW